MVLRVRLEYLVYMKRQPPPPHLPSPHTLAPFSPMINSRTLFVAAPQAARRQTVVNQLVMFMAQLDRCLYNAYEGCVTLAPPATPSRLFFRANRKVCTDWLARIRVPLLICGSSSGSFSGSVAAGLARLQDLMRLVRGAASGAEAARHFVQLQRTLVPVVQGLQGMRQHDLITGLHAWARAGLPAGLRQGPARHLLAWLPPAALYAKGSTEAAAAAYNRLLADLIEATVAAGAPGNAVAVQPPEDTEAGAVNGEDAAGGPALGAPDVAVLDYLVQQTEQS